MDGYHTTHNWDCNASLSSTIIKAITAVKEVDPIEMEPLYTAVDLDALNSLFNSLQGSPRQDGNGRVDFTCNGHRITVLANGGITIR